MEGDDSVVSGGAAVAIAKLEEARAAKSELIAAQKAWTAEVGLLMHEQEAAVDALVSELQTCRNQLLMQREAMASMEVCAGRRGLAAIGNTTNLPCRLVPVTASEPLRRSILQLPLCATRRPRGMRLPLACATSWPKRESSLSGTQPTGLSCPNPSAPWSTHNGSLRPCCRRPTSAPCMLSETFGLLASKLKGSRPRRPSASSSWQMPCLSETSPCNGRTLSLGASAQPRLGLPQRSQSATARQQLLSSCATALKKLLLNWASCVRLCELHRRLAQSGKQSAALRRRGPVASASASRTPLPPWTRNARRGGLLTPVLMRQSGMWRRYERSFARRATLCNP